MEITRQTNTLYQNIVIHRLKTVEPYFSLVRNGTKNFEVRQYTAQEDRRSRDFQVGDVLHLEDVNAPAPEQPEHRQIVRRKISYVLKDTDPCMSDKLAPGFCILGLAPL